MDLFGVSTRNDFEETLLFEVGDSWCVGVFGVGWMDRDFFFIFFIEKLRIEPACANSHKKSVINIGLIEIGWNHDVLKQWWCAHANTHLKTAFFGGLQ